MAHFARNNDITVFLLKSTGFFRVFVSEASEVLTGGVIPTEVSFKSVGKFFSFKWAGFYAFIGAITGFAIFWLSLGFAKWSLNLS